MSSWDELELEHMRLADAVAHLTELSPYPVPRVEDVWRRLRSTVRLFHDELIPHVRAVEELSLPALVETGDTDLVAGMAGLVRDDIEHRLRAVDQVETAVLQRGLSPADVLESVRELAALSALAAALLRFADEVVFPRLRDSLSERDLHSLSDAVLAYEHALARAS